MSKENRNLLVDVDDVLAKTNPQVLSYVNKRILGRKISSSELTRGKREGGDPILEALVQEWLNQHYLVLAVRPYKRALESVRLLHHHGFEIHIASSRKKALHQVTKQWLEEHGFVPFIADIHPRPDNIKGRDFKLMIARKVKAQTAFDDTFSVIETLSKNGVFVYIIDKPWNQTPHPLPNTQRVRSFHQAAKIHLARQGKHLIKSNKL